jgi:hypothetical protein
VEVDPSCYELFVPKLEEENFRGTPLASWNAYLLNNSENRYTVNYDLSYQESGRTYFGGYSEATTKEGTVVVRPRGNIQMYMLPKGERGIRVTKLHVYKCDPDGRLSKTSAPPAVPAPSSSSNALAPTAAKGQPALELSGRELLLLIQGELKQRGLYSGNMDGMNGPMTRAAISKYQSANKLQVDGAPSMDLLKHLQQH